MKRFMLCSARAALLCAAVLVPSMVLAQPGGGFRGGPGGQGGFFGGSGSMGLIARPEVQDELQLVDEQRQKVADVTEEARDEMRDEIRGMFSEMRDLSDDERRERFDEIRTRMESMNTDFEARLKKVLLPHQFDRLKQIDVQVRVQQRGASALSSGELGEALNLTPEQREKLEQRADEVRQEMQEKIRQLQAEARNKMLDVLTPEQRAKLEQLMGDSFELRDDQRFGGRGGSRGEGRRGRGDDGGERSSESRSRSGDEAI